MLDSAIRLLRDSLLTIAPEGPVQHMRAYRRSDVFRQGGVVFVHVPKSAGTSIANAVYGRFIGHFGVADVLSACPGDVLKLPRFSVTRNPWDRLVSAWSFAKAGAGSGSGTRVRMRNPRQYCNPAFADFETFVVQWLAERKIEQLDGVFRSQTSYLVNGQGEVDLTHVGKFEQMHETEEWLSSLLERPISFGRTNTSNHESYRTYYNARTEQIVGDLYASDVELFGYGF